MHEAQVLSLQYCLFFKECSNYLTLSEADREKDFVSGNIRGCDDTLSKNWYRFTGAAGTQMPTQAVPRRACGTSSSGWLSGTHPREVDGIVERTVCFTDFENTCRWTKTIRVRNCTDFFVYELVPVDFCNLRYCGDDLNSKRISVYNFPMKISDKKLRRFDPQRSFSSMIKSFSINL